jgi:hypothetical protein
MAVHEKLAQLVGSWRGVNRLHAEWLPDPIVESPSTATVESKLGGQALAIEYDWEYEGRRREGFLMIDGEDSSTAVNAVWSDSWHLANQLMMCTGKIDPSGRIDIKGFYSVPDNPDWGWRTEIIPGDDGFRYVMYNVSPDGVEEIAVETDFKRA